MIILDEKTIDHIIESTDSGINKYADEFVKNKKAFENLTGHSTFLTNERTVAPVATKNMCLELGKLGFKMPLIVNEFPIKLEFNLDEYEYSLLKKTSSLKTTKLPKNRCYIDGYVQITDNKTVEPTQLFIEYKMEDSFDLLKLANDYLKYKVYTYNHETNTAFAYIIFKKEEMYPSIIKSKTEKPYFELMNKDIVKNPLNGDKRVFIYAPNNFENSKKDLDDTKEALSKINLVYRLADDISNIAIGPKSTFTDEQKIFIDGLEVYNAKVIRSERLRKHYAFIYDVWKKANEKKLFDDLGYIFELKDLNDLTVEKKIKEGAKYLKFLSEKLSDTSKIEATKKGIYGHTQVSLFVVSLIDLFNEKYKLDVPIPDYGKTEIGKGDRKKTHHWSETVDYFKSVITENFEKYMEFEDKNFKKISYCLMFYITNLFPIIYDISDDLKNLSYSKSYEELLLSNLLEEEIKRIERYFKLKEKITVDDFVNNSTENSKQYYLNLINTILERY